LYLETPVELSGNEHRLWTNLVHSRVAQNGNKSLERTMDFRGPRAGALEDASGKSKEVTDGTHE
jgi:hypothetical protein